MNQSECALISEPFLKIFCVSSLLFLDFYSASALFLLRSSFIKNTSANEKPNTPNSVSNTLTVPVFLLSSGAESIIKLNEDPSKNEDTCANVKINPVTVASPIGKQTSLASSSNIGTIGMIKNPKHKADNTISINTSVFSKTINNSTEPIVPKMHPPMSLLYLLVFLSIVRITTLPPMPATTQLALNALVDDDSNPYGLISYPKTTAKSMKQP